MDKRLLEIEARKEEIRALMDSKAEIDLDAIETELRTLDTEAVEIRKKQAIAESLNKQPMKTESRKEEIKLENILESIEYRKAFMAHIVEGKAMPEEFRTVAMSADNGAVIPQVVLNKIIEKLDESGKILPLVTRVAYPTGVAIPTSSVKPTAAWIDEAASPDTQDKKTAKIMFGAFTLACEVGVSFKTRIQSLSAFETVIVNNIVGAMTCAVENAIINGVGTASPKGILKETVPAKRQVKLSAALGYKDIVAIVKAIPSMYKDGAVLVMNESTFMDFEGITDTAGQPVAKVNYGLDAEPVRFLFGKRVVTTDFVPSLDEAAPGAVVAFAVQMDKYVLNTTYEMDMRQYDNDQNRNRMYQSFMVCDGKLADTNGLVLISKASA